MSLWLNDHCVLFTEYDLCELDFVPLASGCPTLGSLWLPLAPFGVPLGSLWVPFGSLWGALGPQWQYYCKLDVLYREMCQIHETVVKTWLLGICIAVPAGPAEVVS